MDSAELLDLLGNANRRRILRLLSRKPCYVTEISEYLGVSPKAVIDHLRKLEEAGLVESRTDDQRRKYFSISRNLRLEVSVSPYEFGTKSAYPANPGLDLTSCRYVSVEVDIEQTGDLSGLAQTLGRLEDLENELSLAQRWVQGRIADVRERIAEDVDEADPRLVTTLLRQLATEPTVAADLARGAEAPLPVVEETLEHLAERGVVEQQSNKWQLVDSS